MLNMEKLELTLANKTELDNMQSSDRVLIKHMNDARDITIIMDKTNLGLAYHVHCMKPNLEGNTFGFPTDFVKFAEKHLGIKKAQAYNLDAVGGYVTQVPGTKIYLDSWTWANILESCDGDFEKAKKKAAKCKTLGSTKVLTVLRLMSKVEMDDADVRAFITEHADIAYDGSVKEFEAKLRAPFKAITVTADEGKTDEGKTDEGKTDEGKTDEGKTDEGKTDKKSAKKVVEIDYFTMCVILTRLVFNASEDDKFVPELLAELNQNTEFWKEYEDYADRLCK